MRRMVAQVVVAGVLTGTTLSHAQQAGQTQAAPPVFKAGVQAVVVAASVRDGRGRIVRNLKKSDFEVIDTGFGRPITEFYSGNAPVSLAVLLDISGSMGIGGNMDRARNAVAPPPPFNPPSVSGIRGGRPRLAPGTFCRGCVAIVSGACRAARHHHCCFRSVGTAGRTDQKLTQSLHPIICDQGNRENH